MVRLVDEEGLARQIIGQLFRPQLIERRMCTGEGVIGRPRLTQIGGDLFDRAKATYARSPDQVFGSGMCWLGHALTIRKADDLVVALDEALLDLFLRRRDHGMTET